MPKPEQHSKVRVHGALTSGAVFDYAWTSAETSTGVVASKAMRIVRQWMRRDKLKGRSAPVAWANIYIERRDGAFDAR